MREPVERALAEAKEERDALAARWAKEKEALERDQGRDAPDRRAADGGRARRARGQPRSASPRSATARSRRSSASSPSASAPENPMVKEEVDEDDIASVVARWTGIPVDRLLEGETEKLIHMEERLHQRVDRPGRGGVRGRERAAPRAHRAAGSRPADRLVRLPRPDGRRQDRARPRARGVHVRRRARDGAARHERVPGAAHGRRGSSARRPATSATTRAASSPRRCGGGRTRWSCSTRSRRRTPRSSTCCCRCSTTAG